MTTQCGDTDLHAPHGDCPGLDPSVHQAPQVDPLDVACPDCAAPAGTPCYHSAGAVITTHHAARRDSARLRSVEHGTCALCGWPLVRGYRTEGGPLTAWHHDPATAAACPELPNPAEDWAAYSEAINGGTVPGEPGLEHFRPASRYDCGHTTSTPGCGGCDPGAIEFVILDNGTRRPYDPDRDLQRLATDMVHTGHADTPADALRGIQRALETPLAGPLSTHGPLCPECAQGKCRNCVGQALDLVTDTLVPCTCTHQED